MSEAAASSIWPATACRRSRELRCRELAGAAGDHQRAAGEGAPAVRGAVGVAGNDADLLGRDAELVGDQLRQGRLQPLAVRRAADPGFEKPEGSIASSTRSKPGVIAIAAPRRPGVPGPVRSCEYRQADAELTALGARRLLSRAEFGDVDERAAASIASR